MIEKQMSFTPSTNGNAHSSKSEKMRQVAESTLSLIVSFGVQGLSFSRVARAANVSRAWLYKYIGKTTEDLFTFSMDVCGKAFAQLETVAKSENPEQWVDQRVRALGRMMDDSLVLPWILPIYYRYRGTQHSLGKRITELEGLFVKKEMDEIRRIFGLEAEPARLVAEMLVAFRLGLAFRWAWTDMHKRVSKDAALHFVTTWLNAVCLESKHLPDEPAAARRTRHGVFALVTTAGGDELLLVKKNRGPLKGRWDLPGGGLEFGEEPLEALRRQIKEETGLDSTLSNLQLFTTVSHRLRHEPQPGLVEDLHLVGTIYRAELGKAVTLKGPKKGVADDVEAAEWVKLRTVNPGLLSPQVAKLLPELKKN